MKNKKIKNATMILLFITVMVIMIYRDNNVLQVTRYKIKSDKIPANFHGFKILQLSDLHNKSFGKNNSALLEKIGRENPNIVVMTGDMINAKNPEIKVFLDMAKAISKEYDTYYIVGNHELAIPEEVLKKMISELTTFGVNVLNNEHVVLKKGKEYINLYGFWSYLLYNTDTNSEHSSNGIFGFEQINGTLGKIDDKAYNILLTHNPLNFQTYADWGADLTLAGHVHGGVIRIPFLGGLLSPEVKLFPKYDSGVYYMNKKELIVNRGLGNSSSIIRVLNRPEISIITL